MNLWHITKMLQDKTGFMWISSWEGLTRFDGYHFVTFKSKAGDGSPLMSNRIRDIELASNGNIYCMVHGTHHGTHHGKPTASQPLCPKASQAPKNKIEEKDKNLQQENCG